MKRAAIYVRVSTSKSEGSGKVQTTEMQVNDLRKYADLKGFQVVEIYEDVGISGSVSSRPALDKLMKDSEGGHFDVVMVWRFDRFARDIQHLLKGLEYFKSKNIDFVSLSENIDTSTSVGMMVFTILGAVAQFERNIISERVKAGLRNAKAKGKRLGRSPVNPEPVLALSQDGYNKHEIAKELGISWHSVHRVLNSQQTA